MIFLRVSSDFNEEGIVFSLSEIEINQSKIDMFQDIAFLIKSHRNCMNDQSIKNFRIALTPSRIEYLKQCHKDLTNG